MPDEITQYMSQDKLESLEAELKELREEKIPALAKRIDDARQMGDLSENAEYHQAREDMAWAQSRVKQIQYILENSEIIDEDTQTGGTVNIGSTVLVRGERGEKEYTIVGAQEADPSTGKISNESPLGSAFMSKKKGDKVEVQLPSGVQEFKILQVK
ncbi:MAG: transcription elongation factor GreA [Candidatus Magasanikiibacteriota bacterium]